jgi:glutamate-1-semialdehyde 2,1-aminomutase
MPWMMAWAGGFPVVAERAKDATIVDVDGHEYVDLCLGDTGAMTGHAPEPVWRVAADRLRRGTTMMLPTGDAAVVGEELRARFGLDRWLFTLSATDANRHAIRIAREITGRPKVLVFSYCYHGSVDEALAVAAPDGRTVAREGNVGAPVDVALTTRAIEFNDVDALEAALAHEDVAVVLAEPAMTNIGIVPAAPGYHDALRALTRDHGTLLLIDETHTLSAGPGGCTRAWGLEPDLLTIGKAIAGGVPTGALGMSGDVVERMFAAGADYEDVGGVGGTLAGNALSLAAARVALQEVLTEEAFARAIEVATRLREGVETAIADHGVPWHVVQLGCRAEYRFAPAPARNGTEAAAQGDAQLERFLHLYALNRGVLITPFHNMALCSGVTPPEAADRHTEVFSGALDALISS